MENFLTGLTELSMTVGNIRENPSFGPFYDLRIKLDKNKIDPFLMKIKNGLESTGGTQTGGIPVDKMSSLFVFEWDAKIEGAKHLIISVPSTSKDWEHFYDNNYEISIVVYPN